MVIKIEPIETSHAHIAIRYAMKKEDATLLKTNLLYRDETTLKPPKSTDVWNEMRLRQKLSGKHSDKAFFRIEICPPKELYEKWDLNDWQKLLDDAIEQIDKTSYKNPKTGRVTPHTMLARSQYVAMIHHDTDDTHIHLVANRITIDNVLQDAYKSKLRGKFAADALAEKYEIKRADERDNQRKQRIHNDAIDVLRNMNHFSLERYFHEMKKRGWDIQTRHDSRGICRGYSIGDCGVLYQASKLGFNKDLKVSTIENTWQKLHPEALHVQREQKPILYQYQENYHTQRELHEEQEEKVMYEYEGRTFYIPKKIDDEIRDNITVPEEKDYENEVDGVPPMPEYENIVATAAAIFASIIIPPSYNADGGGGGGGNNQGWRKRDDEDEELERARKSAKTASRMHTPVHSRKKGGWHM